MQANCDSNTRVGVDQKLAHFVASFGKAKPSEAVLLDTEDSMLSALELANHHFATFLHDDNGYWHLHIFASRIEKGPRHRGISLWHDRIKRDRVCREIERRHGLTRDIGMHRVDELGQIVEIPRAERLALRALKEAEQPGVSDRARRKEIYSGEKSFQTWATEIRIGDRLKHAKSWIELHQAAAAYGCSVQPKGAGFILCPLGEKGAIQLSKLGLKKLQETFGAFIAPSVHPAAGPHVQEARYAPAPTRAQGDGPYAKWRAARKAFAPFKAAAIEVQRERHRTLRAALRARQKAEVQQIRHTKHGPPRHAAISIAKMEHVLAATALTTQFANERQALRRKLNADGPGNTFREFLVVEAEKGDSVALSLARKYGVDEANDVLRQREVTAFGIVAGVTGSEDRLAPRLVAHHQVLRNGTVVYDLGGARTLTDSAISKQVQLNGAAAGNAEAVGVALRFASAKFGNTLTLTGTPEFQRLAVETAVLNRLSVRFADPALDAYRVNLVWAENAKKLQKGAVRVLAQNLQLRTPYDRVFNLDVHVARLAAEKTGRVHEMPDSRLAAAAVETARRLPADAEHARLVFDEKWKEAPAATCEDLRFGTLIERCEDRAVYHTGRGRHVIGPVPGTPERAPTVSKGRGGR
nr:LPD7 domain-containing protein [Propionivibrio soli]